MKVRPTSTRGGLRRYILTSTIAPATLVTSAFAAEVFLPPDQVIDTDSNTAVYYEGLEEGRLPGADNELDPNPKSSTPELTIRMGQLGQNPGDGSIEDGWGANTTWVYTGQIKITTSFLAFALNNDDNDWIKLNGVVVLDDNGWNTPVQADSNGNGNNYDEGVPEGGDVNLVAGLGLTIGEWYDIEFRIGNGGGGAGPSGQGEGWSATYGVGMNTTGLRADNTTPLGNSVHGADYVKPEEPAGNGPELFRYLAGVGFDDAYRVTDSATLTINGSNAATGINSLSFENGATPATLTINDGTGEHKTLHVFGTTTFANADNQSVTISGSADFAPRRLSDGGFTGITVTYDGTGTMSLGSTSLVAPDIDGITFAVSSGTLALDYTYGSPVGIQPLQITGAAGTLRVGSNSGVSIANPISVTASGTLQHTSPATDTLSGPLSISAGRTLTMDVTNGTLNVTTLITSGSLAKTGDGTLFLRNAGNNLDSFTQGGGTTNVYEGITIGQLTSTGGSLTFFAPAIVSSLNVSGGDVVTLGSLNLANEPTITGGALRLRDTANSLPAVLEVSSGGTLDIIPGAAGSSTLSVNGGTLVLTPDTGLTVEFWNVEPPNEASRHPNWGPDPLTQGSTFNGVNTPGAGDFNSFQAYYNGLGAASYTTSSRTNGVAEINFPATNGVAFSSIGYSGTDNYQARWTGYFYAQTAGVYYFETLSDDGSIVFIDQQNIAYNNRFQGMTNARGGSFFLEEGFHEIILGYYEGSGDAGFRTNVVVPGGTSQPLSNSMLFPTNDLPVFDAPIIVSGSSTISAVLPSRATEVTVDADSTLSISGGALTIETLNLSGGTTTLAPGEGQLTTVNQIVDGGADIELIKTGPGILVLNAPAIPHLQSASSSVTINEGQLGLVLGAANSSLGNASLVFNGGGVALTSAGGDQSFALPNPIVGDAAFTARQLGNGVAGPVTITLTGDLNIGSGQTVTLGTADDYTLEVGGTASGGGNLVIGGTGVVATTGTAVEGLNVTIGTGQTAASLRVQSNSLTLTTLNSFGSGSRSLVLGTGSGSGELVINGDGDGRFAGAISEAPGSTIGLIKQGSGTLTLAGVGDFTGGVTLEEGTLVIRNSFAGNAIGDSELILKGGTLQFLSKGLTGEFYQGDDGGANANFGTPETYQNYFANRTPPNVVAITDVPQHPVINFPSVDDTTDPLPEDSAERMFRHYGFTGFDNIVSRMRGQIYIEVEGDYTFGTTSDDGSMLFINGDTVVSSNFYQGMTRREGTVFLTPGYHDIDIGFFEGGGGNGLIVDWSGPGFGRQDLSFEVLSTLDYNDPTRVLNYVANTTIDLRGANVNLGPITIDPGLTVTTTAGSVSFTETNLTAGTYTYDAAGTVATGSINDGGSELTINKTGPGDLVLNGTASQLTNSSNIINVLEGRLVGVGGASNPFGSALVNLDGGNLGVSSRGGAEPVSPAAVQVLQDATITGGNFGGGALDGHVATLSSAVTIPVGVTLTANSSDNYTLQLAGSISGTGSVVVDGGTVAVSGGVNVNTISVNGGTLQASNTVTTVLGTSVAADGVLAVSDATVDGGVNVDGGVVRATQGISDVGAVSFTALNLNRTSDALHGRFIGTGPESSPSLYPGNTVAGLTAAETLPGVEADLQNAQLSFPSDADFNAFFGGVNTTQRYTAGFFGNFFAPLSGTYQVQLQLVDDTAGVWVDLNQNGAFELNGSAGSELIVGRGCCGDSGVVSFELVAGETYRFAAAVEDTGGVGSMRVLAALPTTPLTIIEPGGVQSGLWSYDAPTGGGSIEVVQGAELRASSIDGAVVLQVDGTLRLNSASSASNSVGILRTTTGGQLTVDADNTIEVESFTVAPGTTFVKDGDGALILLKQSIGNGGFLQVNAGSVEVEGADVAANGVAGFGGVTINDGVVNVTGAIKGSVFINGGILTGTGSVGGATLNAGGTLAPGSSPGILTVGDLALSGGILSLELNGSTPGSEYDQVHVTGTVSITGNTELSLTLGYDPEDLVDSFIIVNNAGPNLVDLSSGFLTVAGEPILDGGVFEVGTQQFLLTYNGGDGNDIEIMAVPEPGAVMNLLGGLVTLAGLQRFRRRRK